MSAAIGYTLATGRLYCEWSEFCAFAEELVGRPILTHEYADHATWEELRSAFETRAMEEWFPETKRATA